MKEFRSFTKEIVAVRTSLEAPIFVCFCSLGAKDSPQLQSSKSSTPRTVPFPQLTTNGERQISPASSESYPTLSCKSATENLLKSSHTIKSKLQPNIQ